MESSSILINSGHIPLLFKRSEQYCLCSGMCVFVVINRLFLYLGEYTSIPFIMFDSASPMEKLLIFSWLLCSIPHIFITLNPTDFNVCMFFSTIDSTFFVHSFEETDNFIDKYISSMHRLKYRATVLSDSSLVAKLKKAESIVEKNIQTLKSVGFKVIKMCGILHKSHEKINNFSIGEAESNIINGIDVYSPKYKKSLFITTNTHIPEHKQYCSDLLNNNGICPEFINMDDDSISNFRFNLKLKNGKKVTMNSTILNTILATCTPNQINEIRAHCTQLIMSLYHGGLRCQTNFISPDFLVS